MIENPPNENEKKSSNFSMANEYAMAPMIIKFFILNTHPNTLIGIGHYNIDILKPIYFLQISYILKVIGNIQGSVLMYKYTNHLSYEVFDCCITA